MAQAAGTSRRDDGMNSNSNDMSEGGTASKNDMDAPAPSPPASGNDMDAPAPPPPASDNDMDAPAPPPPKTAAQLQEEANTVKANMMAAFKSAVTKAATAKSLVAAAQKSSKQVKELGDKMKLKRVIKMQLQARAANWEGQAVVAKGKALAYKASAVSQVNGVVTTNPLTLDVAKKQMTVSELEKSMVNLLRQDPVPTAEAIAAAKAKIDTAI